VSALFLGNGQSPDYFFATFQFPATAFTWNRDLEVHWSFHHGMQAFPRSAIYLVSLQIQNRGVDHRISPTASSYRFTAANAKARLV
jgi:hypothetical protein